MVAYAAVMFVIQSNGIQCVQL